MESRGMKTLPIALQEILSLLFVRHLLVTIGVILRLLRFFLIVGIERVKIGVDIWQAAISFGFLILPLCWSVLRFPAAIRRIARLASAILPSFASRGCFGVFTRAIGYITVHILARSVISEFMKTTRVRRRTLCRYVR